jgi:hypothetical protein
LDNNYFLKLSTINEGKYITIHAPNKFFDNIVKMVLEYFDVPERKNTLFLLSPGAPIHKFREVFPSKKIVVYQLEQMLDCNTYFNAEWFAGLARGADEIWDYDPLNIQWLSWRGIKVDRMVPLLYTKSLEWSGKAQLDPDFDVVFLGLLGKRRHAILEKIQWESYQKLKISWVFGDPDMEKHVLRSKVALNLHSFEPWNRQEQVRMFVPVINGKTVVSEKSQLNVMGDLILEESPEKLGKYLYDVCYSDTWKIHGLLARDRYKERTIELLKQWPDSRKPEW